MSHVASKDGTRIAYETRGSGPALLLVDGAMCSRQMGPMPGIADQLQDAFTVHLYDRRGRGESGNSLPYAIEREIEDIEALAGAIGSGFFLFGMSSGALLAALAAPRLPNLERLALFEAPMIVDDTHAPLPRSFVAETDALIARGDRSGAVKKFMRLVGVPGFMLAIMPLLPVWKKITMNADTLAYDLRLVEPRQQGRPLQAEDWEGIRVPTLVVDGGKSPTYMRNAQKQWSERIAGASYKTLPGETHNVKATSIAPLLREFFS